MSLAGDVIVNVPAPLLDEYGGRLHLLESAQVSALTLQTEMAKKQVVMQKSIDENTQVTNQVAGILATFEGGMKFLGALYATVKWVGGICAGALAIWGLLYALAHGVPSAINPVPHP